MVKKLHDKYYTFQEVADMLGVTRKTVYNRIDRGMVSPPVYLSNKPYFEKRKIDRILNPDPADPGNKTKNKIMAYTEENTIVTMSLSRIQIEDLIRAIAKLTFIGRETYEIESMEDSTMDSLIYLQSELADGLVEFEFEDDGEIEIDFDINYAEITALLRFTSHIAEEVNRGVSPIANQNVDDVLALFSHFQSVLTDLLPLVKN